MIASDILQAPPDTAPAEAPAYVEPPVRRRGCLVDLILRFFYFLLHTIALLLVGAAMFGLAGWYAYHLVQRQIQGEEVTAPNLAGLKLDKAMEALAKPGGGDLGLRVSEREFSETVGEGEIISQVPPAMTRVKAGTVIRVKESKGTTKVACPDVRGKPYLDAGILLRNANLTEGEKSFAADPSLKKDYVIAQAPAPGSLQFRGTPVNLLVSLGSEARFILMPSLADLPFIEAQQRLAELGLPAPTKVEAPSPGTEEDFVIAQDPAPGASVAPDAPIKVTVASNLGRRPSPSPSPSPAAGPASPSVPTPEPTPDMPPAIP